MSSIRKQSKYGKNKKNNLDKEPQPFWKKLLKFVIILYALIFLYSTVLTILINVYEKDTNKYLNDEDYKKAVETSKNIVRYDNIKRNLFGYHKADDIDNCIRHEYLYALSNKKSGNLIEVKNVTESILDENNSNKGKSSNNTNKQKNKYQISELKNKKYLFRLQDIAVDNCINLGYFDKAVNSANKYINFINTENVEADDKNFIETRMINKLIILYSRLGRYDKIQKILFENRDANSINQQDMLGLYYFYNRDYEGAADVYDKYIKDNEGDENIDSVKLSLATSYVLNAEYNKAKNILLQIESNSSKIILNKNYLLAHIYTKMRDNESASLYYKMLLDSLYFNQYNASPYAICTKYNYAILQGDIVMKSDAEKLFATLNLTEDSYFKYDINNFCDQNILFPEE